MRFPEENVVFRPHGCKFGLDAARQKVLARTIDEPGPSRIETLDPAKVENRLLRRTRRGFEPGRACLDGVRGFQGPMSGQAEPYRITRLFAGKTWVFRHNSLQCLARGTRIAPKLS